MNETQEQQQPELPPGEKGSFGLAVLLAAAPTLLFLFVSVNNSMAASQLGGSSRSNQTLSPGFAFFLLVITVWCGVASTRCLFRRKTGWSTFTAIIFLIWNVMVSLFLGLALFYGVLFSGMKHI